MEHRSSLLLSSVVVSVLVAGAVGQSQVCDGRNHLTTTTTGSFGLPSARTIGVRFVPATMVPVERIEWFFAPSVLTVQTGGTVSILQESAMATLPSTAPGAVLAQAQWNGTQPVPGWDGGTFASPVLLQAGTPYWLTTTANPVIVHQAPSYEGTGPDPTTYALLTAGTWFPSGASRRFKVRLLATTCLSGTQFQLNQPQASASINGVLGSTASPAMVTLAVGSPAMFMLSSTTLVGAPWDIAIGAAPLVPATGGGITLSDGQIVNVDFSDPTLSFLFSPPLSGFPFANLSGPLNTSNPVARSFQMGISDPSTSSGFRISAATRFVVQ